VIVIEVTACQLVCRAIGNNIIAMRAYVVVDGTTCSIDGSTTAICVQGACTVSDKMVSVIYSLVYGLFPHVATGL